MQRADALDVLVADQDEAHLEHLCGRITSMRPGWRILAREVNLAGITGALAKASPALLFVDVKLWAVLSSVEFPAGRPAFMVVVMGAPEQIGNGPRRGDLDDLVKPVQDGPLEQVLRRAEAVAALQRESPSSATVPKASTVRMYRGADLLWADVKDVCYFQADRKVTRVVLPACEGMLKMGFNLVAEHLDQAIFWRIHRGLLVNTTKLQLARRDEQGRLRVHLSDREESLLVAKAYEYQFRDGFS